MSILLSLLIVFAFYLFLRFILTGLFTTIYEFIIVHMQVRVVAMHVRWLGIDMSQLHSMNHGRIRHLMADITYVLQEIEVLQNHMFAVHPVFEINLTKFERIVTAYRNQLTREHDVVLGATAAA